MYTEHGSRAFESFLTVIGDRIDLRGFPGFLAGLDNKYNNTGMESIHVEWKGFEITYHVSTLLPFCKEDPQQIQRKRHIGNGSYKLLLIEYATS
jgi:hypothetical protein